MAQSTQGSTQSTDYFDDDPEFIKAISELPLPGDECANRGTEPQLAQRPKSHEDEHPISKSSLKRARSPEDAPGDSSDDGALYHTSMNVVDSRKDDDGNSYLDGHTYGASRFGEFREYMTRKRAKLKVQNAEIDSEGDEGASRSKLFSGLQIYVCTLSGSGCAYTVLMTNINR